MHYKIDGNKVNKIIFICFIILCSVFNINRVDAGLWEGSADVIPPGSGWGFGGSRDFERVVIATGYRVTVVNSSGDRVNSENNIINGKGYASISIDYWSDALIDEQERCTKPSVYFLTEKCFIKSPNETNVGSIPSHIRGSQVENVISYIRKKPKTNRNTNDKRLLGLLDSSEGEGEWNKKNQFNFLNINSKCGTSHTDCLSGEYSDKFGNNNYADHAAKYLNDIGVSKTSGVHSDATYQIVAAFLINSRAFNYMTLSDNTSVKSIYNSLFSGFNFNGDKIPKISYGNIDVNYAKEIVAEATKRKFYMLVEPVMAIQLASNWDNTNNPILIGSAADLAHLDILGKAGWGNSDYIMMSALHPVVFTQGNEPIAGIIACPSLDTSHETVNEGVTANKNSCLGVFVFDLVTDFDELLPKCHTKAKDFISTYLASDRSSTAKQTYIDSLATDEDTKDCVDFVMYGPEPKYETTKCNVLDPNNIDLAGGVGEHSEDVCTSYTCQELANIVYDYYKDKPNQIGVDGSDYENRIINVKKEYDERDHTGSEDYNELLTSFWSSDPSLSGPTCGYMRVKSCPVDDVNAKCDSSGKMFSLSDTNKTNECIKLGTAYNNLDESGNPKGGGSEITQSSEDVSSDNNGNCWESVSFDFPGDVTGIKAGTVFIWGTKRSSNGSVDSKVFGTMNVTRKCYLSGKSTITMKWADENIRPTIEVNYKEAIPSDVSQSSYKAKIIKKNLTVTNTKKTINVYNGSGTRIGGNSTGVSENCGGNCNSAAMVDMTASYDIVYGNEFKWSSNKNNKSTELTLIDSDSEHNFYATIGYGLPTTFVTPTGLKGDYYFGSSLDVNDGNGYVYVKVNNVGTCKNGTNDCHFNQYITFAVEDDNDLNNDSIYYRCKYDIINEIFGNEDHDPDPNVTPKGLDVVFRTVQLINKNDCVPNNATGVCTGNTSTINNDLNKAFPGRSGKGRYTNGKKIGRNWLKINTDENKNIKKIFDILDNMVYAQEPAYHIVLDTGKINYIREQNKKYRNGTIDTKKIKSDPYTDNRYFKFDKTNAPDYAYGASEFISDLANRSWIDGDCTSGDTDARAKNGPCRQT